MCRAPLKISLLSGLPVEILQLQLPETDSTRIPGLLRVLQTIATLVTLESRETCGSFTHNEHSTQLICSYRV